MIREYSLSRHGGSYKLSRHFRLWEFASGDGADRVLVDTTLLNILESLRSWADAPVWINSGYRSEAHNRAIGGVHGSRHTTGEAADVRVGGKTPAEVAAWARRNTSGSVGLYDTFVHISTRPEASAFWDNRTVKDAKPSGGPSMDNLLQFARAMLLKPAGIILAVGIIAVVAQK